MNSEITLQTRREFLRQTVLGGALSWTVPTFLANTFAALQAEADRVIAVSTKSPLRPNTVTARMDAVLLHPVWGILILLAVLFVMFQAVFSWAQPLMDVITGKTRPSHGKAWFGETLDLTQMSEVQIAQSGIGRKFQKPTVFEALSVFENLELAQKTDKSVWASLRARLTGELLGLLESRRFPVGEFYPFNSGRKPAKVSFRGKKYACAKPSLEALKKAAENPKFHQYPFVPLNCSQLRSSL